MSERNPLPACLSHLGQMAPVPEGYVLVPVELPEIASSILETILRASSGFGLSPMNVRGIWRALITAASDETSPPAPPTPVAGMTEAQVDLLLAVADEVASLLRGGSWSYALFDTDGQRISQQKAATIESLARRVRSASMPVQSAQGSVDQERSPR